MELFGQLADADGEFADDARFRLGALYFEQRDYLAAAREFAALRTSQPDSPLASVAELNAGYAQYYLERLSSRQSSILIGRSVTRVMLRPPDSGRG